MLTVTDKRMPVPVSGNPSVIASYTADVTTAVDYSPFGMSLPGRIYNNHWQKYRYGFNGQEADHEISGPYNSYNAEFWQYDPRLGRRWNLDPRPTVGISPYATFNNSPILFSDPHGDTSVVGAGGGNIIDIDEKVNKLEFYGSGGYNVDGKSVPVQPGQLRSFKNDIGKFSAKWNVGNDGATFAGYLNDKGQTVNEAVESFNKFAASPLGRLLSWAIGQAEEAQMDPLSFNVKMSTNLLVGAAMVATEPVAYVGGYNPSVVTKAENPFLGYVGSWTPKVAEGSFSIWNWQGYPNLGTKPVGPFRLLTGGEYVAARNLADRTNAAIHNAAPYLKGLEIHEIQPVKFGGSPTSAANKLFLTPEEHRQYTNFWNSVMRNINK